jgi:polyisoprenoid-binding protein YceI
MLITLACSLQLSAAVYTLDATKKSDTVQFRSQAMLEVVEGMTTQALGSFRFDPSNLTDSVTGIIQVDLRTIETGIKMRDQHMRDNYLEASKFPHAYFQVVSVVGLPAAWKPDSVYALTANGYFYIHGFKRKLTAQIWASQHSAEGQEQMSIKATFAVNLESFEIRRPKVIFLKLAETMSVSVIFKGYSGLEATAITLPDWPELQ